ncbi:MAG: L-lactate permease, partial [Proteobacteria bacterium]|nr:L-lactate permease [Pseudomonadota bacterium]
RLGAYTATVVVTVLGGVGAFATGSGVTSNALFMSSAAATGASLDVPVLFAALQHSGSAHVAMASLPVIAILTAALPNRRKGDERAALRAGLGLAAVWLLLVIASGWTQLYWAL